MKAVLCRPRPRLPSGSRHSRSKALSRRKRNANCYDRWLFGKGRPLRYGMGAGWIDGKKDFNPIEDRANVDVRRRAIGLGTLAETAKGLNIGNWCGGSSALAR